MKRTIAILLLTATVIVALFACGSNAMRIEDYEWTLHYAMQSEASSAVVDAVGTYDPAYPEATIVTVTLTAHDGKLTLFDQTNRQTYEGTYTVVQKTPAGTDYRMTIDGKEGYATVSMTTYFDGGERPTLPINLGAFSLYFYADLP